MIAVWHAKKMLGFRESVHWPSGYEKVALVATHEPGEAFELTNHIHSPWHENAGVTFLMLTPRRSTSVGDILETDAGHLLVAGVGFVPIPGVAGGTEITFALAHGGAPTFGV